MCKRTILNSKSTQAFTNNNLKCRLFAEFPINMNDKMQSSADEEHLSLYKYINAISLSSFLLTSLIEGRKKCGINIINIWVHHK